MANIKITDLTAYTDPAATDVLPIVDVGADVTKKVSIQDLLENAGSGTAAAPGIAFDGDSDTGLYSPGADQVALSTNGTGRLFVDASGNVGVGSISTSSFQSASSTVLSLRDTATGNVASLKVLGGVGAGAIAEYGATNGIGFCGTSGAHDFTFYTNSAERLRITSAGLVGIGTSDPASLLHLSGAAGNGRIELQNTSGDNVTNWRIAPVITGFTNNGFEIRDVTQNASRFVINSSGNVGIGTTGPGYLIDASNSSAPTLRLTDSVRHLLVRGGSTTQNPGIGTDYAGDLSFFTNGTANERARIDGSGRLLVGTSSDSGGALLQVNGDRIRVATAKTPASASDTGTTGEICWDASYIYVCTATNTWKRAALSTW